MIAVHETKPGHFERITGNPILLSIDGEAKASLRSLMASSWTDEERARFGIYLVEPAEVPEGKRALSSSFKKQDGRVVQVHELEDMPPPNKRGIVADVIRRTKQISEGAVVIAGLGYAVLIDGDLVSIGCVTLTPDQWDALSDDEIRALHPSNPDKAIGFKKYLPTILEMARSR